MIDRNCVDILRLSEEEHRALLQDMDDNDRLSTAPEQRDAIRYRYHVREGLILVLEGSNTNYKVRPRNISANGVSILHGSFVYPGTACTVALVSRDERRVLVPGRVIRCRCVHGRAHEVGVRFDCTVEVSEFVEISVARTVRTPVQAPPLPETAYSRDKVMGLSRRLQELAAAGADRDELLRTIVRLVTLIHGNESGPPQPCLERR